MQLGILSLFTPGDDLEWPPNLHPPPWHPLAGHFEPPIKTPAVASSELNLTYKQTTWTPGIGDGGAS